MTHVSTRRASRRLTSGVAAVALAATCFAAVSVTALPASADTTETSAAAASDSQAVTQSVVIPGALVDNSGITDASNVSDSGLVETTHFTVGGEGVTEIPASTAAESTPELIFDDVPLNTPATDAITLVIQITNPTATALDFHRMQYAPQIMAMLTGSVPMPFDGTAFDGQESLTQPYQGLPRTLRSHTSVMACPTTPHGMNSPPRDTARQSSWPSPSRAALLQDPR